MPYTKSGVGVSKAKLTGPWMPYTYIKVINILYVCWNELTLRIYIKNELILSFLCLNPKMRDLLNFVSSSGLCPWRAYVVTQALASVGIRVRVSTMLEFLHVCIVF